MATLTFRLLCIAGLAAVILALLLLDFISRSDASDHGGELPRTAIVFTGQYDRIDLGLELLASDRIDRLLISGANRTSGLIDVRFPGLFDPTSEHYMWIETGRIILTPDAHSTFENAVEAACWLETQSGPDAVTLITSQRHMARASLALQRAIGPVSVVRAISDPSENYDKYQIDMMEFSRFAATWAVTLLPRALWPSNEMTICSEG